jgi:hypothetical protein
MEQAVSLEPVFAVYTKNGWVIPKWLEDLKLAILIRNLEAITAARLKVVDND